MPPGEFDERDTKRGGWNDTRREKRRTFRFFSLRISFTFFHSLSFSLLSHCVKRDEVRKKERRDSEWRVSKRKKIQSHKMM